MPLQSASTGRLWRLLLKALRALKRLGILEQTELKFDESIQLFEQVLASDPSFSAGEFLPWGFLLRERRFYPSHWKLGARAQGTQPTSSHSLLSSVGIAILRSRRRSDLALNDRLLRTLKTLHALYQLARIYKNASLRSIEMLKVTGPGLLSTPMP